jgi:hypothetical protein
MNMIVKECRPAPAARPSRGWRARGAVIEDSRQSFADAAPSERAYKRHDPT